MGHFGCEKILLQDKNEKQVIASFLLNLFGTFTFSFHQTLLVNRFLHLFLCEENSGLDVVQVHWILR